MSDHDDVCQFHDKFGVGYSGPPRFLPPDLLAFRMKFLDEELKEFVTAVREKDLVKAFDALIDLVYVAHGTAQLMGLPWHAGWDAVQAANMAKVRAASAEESLAKTGRGHATDIVKPPGWVAPDETLRALLERAGWDAPYPRVGVDPAKPGAERTYYHGLEREVAPDHICSLPVAITEEDFRDCPGCGRRWNYVKGRWVSAP